MSKAELTAKQIKAALKIADPMTRAVSKWVYAKATDRTRWLGYDVSLERTKHRELRRIVRLYQIGADGKRP